MTALKNSSRASTCDGRTARSDACAPKLPSSLSTSVISANTGAGCDLLNEALTELLAGAMVRHRLNLAPAQGRLRASLYELGAVEEENHSGDGYVQLLVRMSRRDWQRLLALENLSEDKLLLDGWRPAEQLV